jgi:hypothetical protein
MVADKLAVKFSQKAPGAKQVRLRLVHVDFWSAVRVSFLVAVAVGIVTVGGVFLVYWFGQATGVVGIVDQVFLSLSDGGVSVDGLVALPQVMAFAVFAAFLNLVVVTVLGAVIAEIYNLAVTAAGGFLVGFISR